MISRELFVQIVSANVRVSNLREFETAMTQATQPRYNLTQAHCARCMQCVRCVSWKLPFTMETGLNANWI